MKTGVELIDDERRRQIEIEGWSAEHDDRNVEGQLAGAAICYVAESVRGVFCADIDGVVGTFWPFDVAWWKPGDSIRNLVKAGALIAAEIDRLQRDNTDTGCGQAAG